MCGANKHSNHKRERAEHVDLRDSNGDCAAPGHSKNTTAVLPPALLLLPDAQRRCFFSFEIRHELPDSQDFRMGVKRSAACSFVRRPSFGFA